MTETGIVVQTGPGKAQVRIQRSEACEGCHGCLMSETGKFMTADVIDRIGVSVGDEVSIATEGASPLKSAVLLFLFPLILLFAGYFTGSAIAPLIGMPGSAQALGIACSALFFFGSFGLLYLFTHRKSGASAGASAIVEILGKGRTMEP